MMPQQEDGEQEERKERRDHPTSLVLLCPFTITGVEETRRACIGVRCAAFYPFNRASPEDGGLCMRCYRGVLD